MKALRIIVFLFFLSLSGSNYLNAQTLKAWLQAGDKSMEDMRFAEAIEYYNNALAFETGDLTIMYKMAEASRLYKDYERAAIWYGKTVLEDQSNRFPLAVFRFAEMKKYLGMYEESARLFERYAALTKTDSSYFQTKANFEIAAMPEVMKLAAKQSDITITNAGSPVNTNYSEFGASLIGDSTLYFASLRFLYESKDKKTDDYYVSRILQSSKKNAKFATPVPMNILFNDAKSHNGNLAFSPDFKVAVFSRCLPEGENNLECELYYTRMTDGKWSKPELIPGGVNLTGYTATQPALGTRGADGYVLYFVSDRPGGTGKLDIWTSLIDASFAFGAPENPGPPVNTFDDEMTPYFDSPNQTLYFSSYGHVGLGGMDIMKSIFANGNFNSPENLGPGINTSVNDVYYTLNKDYKSGTLSSNRKGSMFIGSKTCCYDIYLFNIPEKDTTPVVAAVDSTLLPTGGIKPTPEAIEAAAIGNKATYEEFLPLELYFENDQPGKRSYASTTTENYEKLYQEYLAAIPEYKQKYSGKLTGLPKANAESEIDTFFVATVTKSYNRLNTFAAKIQKALEAGYSIELEVRGRTSPLAKSEYNELLSRRRIASLVNFFNIFNNGVLNAYLKDGKLKVTEVPAGETLVASGVSDQLKDKRNSVYHPAAASERKIEVINIQLVPPQQ